MLLKKQSSDRTCKRSNQTDSDNHQNSCYDCKTTENKVIQQ